jgi:hypothetical protein
MIKCWCSDGIDVVEFRTLAKLHEVPIKFMSIAYIGMDLLSSTVSKLVASSDVAIFGKITVDNAYQLCEAASKGCIVVIIESCPLATIEWAATKADAIFSVPDTALDVIEYISLTSF